MGGSYGGVVLLSMCWKMYLPLIYVYSLCSSPFELHDDNYVLKAMDFGDGERPQSDNVAHNIADGGEGSSMSGMYQSQVPQSVSNMLVRPPTSPPLPGILKARVKQEHWSAS